MLVSVGVGAALGACLRYGLTTWIKCWYSGKFPLATLIINVSGAFLIGIFSGVLSVQNYAFLATGILGGYTTFSTFNVELLTLCRNHKYFLAGLYFGSSVILGIIAVFVAKSLVE